MSNPATAIPATMSVRAVFHEQPGNQLLIGTYRDARRNRMTLPNLEPDSVGGPSSRTDLKLKLHADVGHCDFCQFLRAPG